MRFYTKQHHFYCGVDLHADAMYVCVLDSSGDIVAHRNLPTTPKVFLRLIKPFRDNLVVGCKCHIDPHLTAGRSGSRTPTF